MTIAVAVVEDDASYADRLKQCLVSAVEFRCIGSWRTAEAALREVSGSVPDVLVADLELPRRSGTDLIRNLSARLTNLRSLVLTKFDNPGQVFEAIRAGAHGYVLKTESFERIAQAIREVHAGGCPMTPHISRMTLMALRELLPDSAGADKLTRREREGTRDSGTPFPWSNLPGNWSRAGLHIRHRSISFQSHLREAPCAFEGRSCPEVSSRKKIVANRLISRK